MNLQEGRDVVIIVAGSLTILVLLALLVLTLVLGVAARMLLSALQTLLKEEVTPLLGSARHTVQRVHGTTTFVGETAVAPIIRVYGAVAGTRRAMAVLSGLAGRRRRRQDGEPPS